MSVLCECLALFDADTPSFSLGVSSDGPAGPDGQATGGTSLGTVAGGVNTTPASTLTRASVAAFAENLAVDAVVPANPVPVVSSVKSAGSTKTTAGGVKAVVTTAEGVSKPTSKCKSKRQIRF